MTEYILRPTCGKLGQLMKDGHVRFACRMPVSPESKAWLRKAEARIAEELLKLGNSELGYASVCFSKSF